MQLHRIFIIALFSSILFACGSGESDSLLPSASDLDSNDENAVGTEDLIDSPDVDESTIYLAAKLFSCPSDWGQDITQCVETTEISVIDSGIVAVSLTKGSTPLVSQMIIGTVEYGTSTLSPARKLTNTNGVAYFTLDANNGEKDADSITFSIDSVLSDSTVTIPFEVVDSNVDISVTNNTEGAELAQNSTALITANLSVDGEVYTDSVYVNFTSTCVEAGTATIDASVLAVNGIAQAIYQPNDCYDEDTITASTELNSVVDTTTITVANSPAASISFISATPTTIAISGTGGVDRQETSTVSFQVFDQYGSESISQDVQFELENAPSGTTIDPEFATSNSDGEVSTVVTSGSVPGIVKVKVKLIDSELLISSVSSELSISTGLPDQDSFSVALENFSPEVLEYDGEKVGVTVRLADHYNNAVSDGTTVFFQAEAGAVNDQSTGTIGSCTTEGSTCSVNWVSGGEEPDGNRLDTQGLLYGCAQSDIYTFAPCVNNWGQGIESGMGQPFGGRVTITAYTVGEENFVDRNGDGKFTPGEPFTDDNCDGTYTFNEPFVDSNSDGIYTSAEDFVDADGDGVYTVKEQYTDTDGDGEYTPAESFTDINGDGVYNHAESFTDTNGDGVYTPAESFTDTNGDGEFTPAESFVDSNGDGIFNEVAEVYIDANDDGKYTSVEEFIDSNNDGQYTVAEDYIDSDGNGEYTPEELFTDDNGDGEYTSPEAYTDADSNGEYTQPEPYTDSDGNGSYTSAESFVDTNGDGIYTPAELFIDTDGNGKYTVAEALLIDRNSDGVYTAAESYTDTNADGSYTLGELFVDANADGLYTEADTFIDAGNGIYTLGEEFTDTDGNGEYTLGESFVDVGDGVYTSAESFTDSDSDGVYTDAEAYTDRNLDGKYTFAENYTDTNKDNEYSAGDPYNDINLDGVYNPGDAYQDSNGDGKFTLAEPYTDSDGSGSYTYAETFTDSNGDGVYTYTADSYTDSNGDGEYTAAETFTDSNGDGAYTPAEVFTDSNGDGEYTSAEAFVDSNGDGVYTSAEVFIDRDNDGEYTDFAEPFVDSNGDGEYTAVAESYTDSDGNGEYTYAEIFTDTDGNGEYTSRDSFTDENGDEKYTGDTFSDKAELFYDYNEDGLYRASKACNVYQDLEDDPSIAGADQEESVDFNQDGEYSFGNGLFNGLLCSVDNASAGLCERELVHVSDDITLIMASKNQYMRIQNNGVDTNHVDLTSATGRSNVTLFVYIADIYNNRPPAESVISVTTSNGVISSDSSIIVPSSNAFGPYLLYVDFERETDGNEVTYGTATIKITTPKGTITSYNVGVSDDS